MARWHHNSLCMTLSKPREIVKACCGPWGHKGSDTTYQLNNKNVPATVQTLRIQWRMTGTGSSAFVNLKLKMGKKENE